MLKTPPLIIKRASNQGSFTALAATFDVDRQGDRILPGAFEATLAAWGERGGRIPLLWNHSDSEPLGSVTATETPDGLQVEALIELLTERGRQAHELLKAGGLSCSIGFLIPPGGANQVGAVREISAVDLIEISLVAVPANPSATISNVKHFTSPRELEHALRDAGLSARHAKRLMAGGWQALSDAPDESAEDLNLIYQLNSLKEFFK